MKINFIKGKYSPVFFIAIGAAATLISIVLFSGSPNLRIKKLVSNETKSKPDNLKPIELDDAAISLMLSKNITGKLPITNIKVHIDRDGVLKLTADVKTDEFLTLMETNDVQIPSAIKLFINLMPESVSTSLDLKIAVDLDQKLLSLEPLVFKINGIDLSGDLIPKQVKTIINDSVNKFLKEHNISIGGLELQEGKIIIKPVFNNK